MIKSAIVLSKAWISKQFKRRCLCHWLVDSSYLENWLKHNHKLHNIKISFCRNNWYFQACGSHEDNIIFPLIWLFIFSNCVGDNPLRKYIYWQNMRLEIRESCLENFRTFLRSFRIYFPGFSNWTSDCLWVMAIKEFLRQGSQDKWYFSTSIFS